MRKVERVVVWVSGGVSSMVAAKLAIKKYKGIYEITLAICDTGSEHDENWRFIRDGERWLNHDITVLKSEKYTDTIDVYEKTKWLVGVRGARCSQELKKAVRQKFENIMGDLQIFGYAFDKKEQKRAHRFQENNPEIMCEFPLIDSELTKANCQGIIFKAGIKRPSTYDYGFKEANCLKRGCVKGQAGYWNLYRKFNPDGFWAMARLERKLDVAICKTEKGGIRQRIFLDELPLDQGNYKTEPPIQCGILCGEI
ncbi:MAG: phosphoadenosine phosphosulfate reductase family protein [Ketobacter sp.]|nr:phosphoadenosine phosphosulfate reductase family protein [Ketobacter sp.]